MAATSCRKVEMPHTQDLVAKGLNGLFFSLGLLTLLVCLAYGKLLMTQVDPDFRLEPTTWEVTAGQNCDHQELCLEPGDLVIEIDGVTLREYLSDRSQVVSWTGEQIAMRFLRHGQEMDMILEPSTEDSWIRRLEDALIILVSLVFWCVATAAGLFMRPRDSRWALLILFGYGLGLWFAAGALSSTQMAFSVWVFHCASWLALPLMTHLHLSLPSRILPRSRRWILPVIYLVSGIGAWLDLTYLLPEGTFGWPVVLALGLSLALLTGRQFQRVSAAERRANRLMLFGMVLGLGPWFLVVALSFPIWLDEQSTSAGQSVVLRASLLATVPLWPVTYLLAAAKNTLGDIEFRTNRLLGLWSFIIYVILLQFVVLAIGFKSGFLQSHPAEVCLALGLFLAIIGKPMMECCQSFLDRKVLGLRYSPDEILGVLAFNIPRLHEAHALPRLLHDTILPTLLIRQSAIYVFDDATPRPVDEFGVEPLTPRELNDLPNQTREDLDPQPAPKANLPDWVKLALPLWADGTLAGLWLVGRRDPDDYYTQSDIALLRRVGNQIGSSLRIQQEIAENRRLEEQLFQAQKLEALGRLSAGVAHDFNNLLSVIRLNSEFMRPRVRLDDTSMGHLENILGASERAKSLIRQLVTFGRQQQMQFRLEDVDDIVDGTQTMLHSLLTDSVRLGVRRRSGLPKVEVDRGRLEQVIVNLVLNASQAMPEGGPVEVWTEYLDAPPPQSSLPPDAGYVALHIRDHGDGIPKHLLSKVFEPFFTTKPTGMGTGLGLSIVYGIVQQFGGQITIESEVGLGTTFSVWLPAVSTGGYAQQFPQADSVKPPPQTLIVVEDEAILRQALTEALEHEGYNVLTASDGQDALELLKTCDEGIDLLLTDVRMPRMGGIELAKRLLDRNPDLAILFMSGHSDRQLAQGSAMPDGVELLRKPFSIDVLIHRVSEALVSPHRTAPPLRSTSPADSIV